MAEESGLVTRVFDGEDDDVAEASGSSQLDPIAAALAVTGRKRGRSFDPELASYLAKQEQLVSIQTEHLHEQRSLQLAHLRVRRWKDRTTLALQGAAAFVAACAAAALVVIGWQAHEDHGVVVEAFTAPPGFATRGVSGGVVASDLVDRLSSIVSFVREHSFSSTSAATTDTSSDVKVEIPATGISLTDLGRALRDWLGSSHKVNGSLREEGDGRLTLTARIEGGPAFSATGPVTSLAALEQNVAEQIYGFTDPNNLPIYLVAQNRKVDAVAAVRSYVARAVAREDRANSVTMLGDISDDPHKQAHFGQIALAIDPGLMAAHFNVSSANLALEHPQVALREARAMLDVSPADQPQQHRGTGAYRMIGFARSTIDQLTGDYSAAVADRGHYLPNAPQRADLDLDRAIYAGLQHDPNRSFKHLADADVLGTADPGQARIARFWAEAASENWAGALAQVRQLVALDQLALVDLRDPDRAAGASVNLARRDAPLLALAQARTQDTAAAAATIGSTPIDCYFCLRTRGVIAAAQMHFAEAEHWFGAAIRQAPQLPQAYGDRGQSRLSAGNITGALADAEIAGRLGPRYADAFRLWGDALARQRRWKEAVDKYARALAEAPAWEALMQAKALAQSHR